MSIRYVTRTQEFEGVPGKPIVYWASGAMIKTFSHDNLYKYSVSPSQNVTGNNSKFLRKHWELEQAKIDKKDSWIFYAKGGEYRKWWGNLENIINWTPQARYIYQHGDGRHASQIINQDYWYKTGITWGLINSSNPSFRVMPEGATFDKGGSTIIVEFRMYYFALGLLNSKLSYKYMSMLNPTMNFQVRDICSIPVIQDKQKTNQIDDLVKDNIAISKQDWDCFETSWEFKRHPLL